MAEIVVTFLVERLGDFLIQEAKFLYGVGDQVKRLQVELQRMQSFLTDADSKQEGDARVRNWVAEIRDLAYDAEDVIDTFTLEIASKRSSGRIKKVLKWFAKCTKVTTLHNVGSRIEEIMTQISDLTRSLQTYGIKELKEGERLGSSNAMRRELRRTYSHTVDHNVVGLEEDAKILVAQLVKREDHNRVVSICGMGGLGKTTLAKKVYHHDQVRRHFDHFIWAYISQEWQRRDIWEELLFKLISPSTEQRKEILKMKDDEVAKKLYQLLQEKNCLVILDDIWDVNAWDCLSAGFPIQDTNSRILLTSRNKDVAQRADPRGFLYEPSCLNDGESWELFEKIAIYERNGADGIAYTSMTKLGSDMVKHCRGLPLAIIVLGGILATKQTFGEWKKVHENIKSHLKRGKGHDEHLRIFDVLSLSYDDLPFRLKSCFLYLGQFPEDFEILARRLINLWVAEDIILSVSNEEENGETLEDVAYRYLSELTERYMVQVERKNSSGRIKSCRMHDLMRELCLSKVKENNFFQILHLRNSNRQVDFFSSHMINRPSSTGKIRRLSVHLNNFSGSVPLEYEECPPIRSLLGFRIDRHSGIKQELIESMVSSFKLLRVFDLEEIRGFAIPKGIEKLIHLRLLTLNSVVIGRLSSIGNLRNLLSLNLEDLGHSAEKIPDVIWKMKQLRHLYLPIDCGSRTKRLQLANLNNLQTLKNFPASQANVEDLITLTNLRKLGIIIPDHVSWLNRFMGIFKPPTTFNHLRSLSMTFWGGDLERKGVEQIVSCCPSLSKLKQNRTILWELNEN